MSEKYIIYNGTEMHPDWPAQIEAAQDFTVYLINGKSYPRIKYGDEPEDWGQANGPCGDCGVVKGQYHVPFVCDIEFCPCCGGQALSCDCEYEGDEE